MFLFSENTFLTGGQRLADHRNGTLSIAQAAKDDQGWYHCEAIGNQGEKAVGSLYIRVVGKICDLFYCTLHSINNIFQVVK